MAAIKKAESSDEIIVRLKELSGQQALNYVRERSSTPNADIGRMKRQQAFVASMINKVISAGTLTHPSRVYNFLKAATASITTDPGLSSLSKLVNLSWQFRKTNLDNISFITVPFEEYQPDPNRLQWSPAAKGLWKVILNDEPLPKKYREVREALREAGWEVLRQRGSHEVWGRPGESVRIVVAGKDSQTVPVGTLSSIRKASGLEHLR